MAPKKSENRIRAEQIWLESGGAIKLKDIASQIGVSDSQVRNWKTKDKWDEKLSVFPSNESIAQSKEPVAQQVGTDCATDKKEGKKGGAPPGNINAKNNKGGAPNNNLNAVGHGAPTGNLNALKTGEFVSPSLLLGLLDEDEKHLLESETTDPFYIIDKEIKELSSREWYMTKLIIDIKKGLSKPARRLLHKLKPGKYDDIEEEAEDEYELTEIHEMEYRPLEEILSIQAALDRVTDKLLKATKQKHDMAVAFEHKRRMDEEKLKLDRERLEFQMKQHSLKNGEGGESGDEEQFDITQDIVENNPDLIDAIFKRGLENRGGPGEPDGI